MSDNVEIALETTDSNLKCIYSNGQARSAIILIPGTFSRKKPANPNIPRWFDENSVFIDKVNDEKSCNIFCLEWDTKNTYQSRSNASNLLSNKINNNFGDYEKIYLIAHSHGGNIAFESLSGIDDNNIPRIEIITMATPFVTMGEATMDWRFCGVWYCFLFLSLFPFIYIKDIFSDTFLGMVVRIAESALLVAYGSAPGIYYLLNIFLDRNNDAPLIYGPSANYRNDEKRRLVPLYIMRSPYDEATLMTCLPGLLYSLSKLVTDVCIEVLAAPVTRVRPEEQGETRFRAFLRISVKSLILLSPFLFLILLCYVLLYFKFVVGYYIPVVLAIISFGFAWLSCSVVCVLNFLHIISYHLLGMRRMGLKDADISIDSAPDHAKISLIKTYLTKSGRMSPLRLRHSLYNDPACVEDIVRIINSRTSTPLVKS